MRPTSMLALALLVAIPTAGCMTGPSATSYRGVREAKGAQVQLVGKRGKVKGELLALAENDFVVLVGCDVRLIAFELVRHSSFKGVHLDYKGYTPSPQQREHLRVVSRFPTGITPPVMQELLKCSGRAKPVVMEI